MPTGLGGEKIWLCPTLEGENLDLSGNGNHGTYQGGMGIVADKYKGKRTYSLDGSDDYIDLGNVFNPAGAFSITFWARVTKNQQMFISKNWNGTSEPYISRLDSNGTLRFYTYDGAFHGTAVNGVFVFNQWTA